MPSKGIRPYYTLVLRETENGFLMTWTASDCLPCLWSYQSTGPSSVGATYGKLALVYEGANLVRIKTNEYDFRTSDHDWFGKGHFWRNVITTFARFDAELGWPDAQPYNIEFSGYGYLNAAPNY